MRKTYTRVDRIAGNVIVVTAEDIGYGELTYVSGVSPSLARVIKIARGRPAKAVNDQCLRAH